MAHPMMGMLVKGFAGQPQLGERVRGFGHPYPRDGADFGMLVEGFHGMGAQPQMGDIFSDLLNQLSTSAQKGLTKAENDAIASVFKTVASDPVVQQAVVSSGNDAAITKLAQQLKAGQAAAVANPWTTAAIVASLGIGGLLLFKAIVK